MIKIYSLDNLLADDILSRERKAPAEVEASVDAIISAVKANGDSALLDCTERFDGVRLDSVKVTQQEILDAIAAVGDDFMRILSRAKDNITEYHTNQIRGGFELKKDGGIVIGQRILPLKRVGIYVPGGTASYPSSVLMNALPAKLAGVKEIIMATPPGKDGKVAPSILAAAYTAGVTTIIKVGGAQAVAALAYGTESVPRVDKIVGPGNIFVATAKRRVYGIVDIDMEAGPSEILVIADKTCNPVFVAADLLSQAEHDKLASSILITDSVELADAVAAEIERQIPLLSRADIARASIDANGKIIVTDSLYKAIEVSNEIAPEHLEICVDNPFPLYEKVINAGSVFLGKYTPEALGDYFAGTNHVLPTSGTARFASPLSVDDFIKKNSYLSYSKEALLNVRDDIAAFAMSEGLTAHAKSVTIRFEE